MPEPRLLKTIFTYPWDLHDDGPERALDVIQNDARLNGVSLAVADHVRTHLYNHSLARTDPDAARQNAPGNPYLAQFCPANPQVRQHALALTDAVMANVRPDALYIESLSYLPWWTALHSITLDCFGWSSYDGEGGVSQRP